MAAMATDPSQTSQSRSHIDHPLPGDRWDAEWTVRGSVPARFLPYSTTAGRVIAEFAD